MNLKEPKITDKNSWWCGKNKIDEFKGVSWSDAIKFWNKNKKSVAKLIGYQIVSNDGKNEIPNLFHSFEVIADAYVAEKWLALEKANPENGKFRWVLLPIFEGDVEEPTFIESI